MASETLGSKTLRSSRGRRVKTGKEALALAQRRNQGLEDAASRDPGFSCQGMVGEFIGLYLRCELFGTRLQHYYQTDRQHAKTTLLKTDTLQNALIHFSMSADTEKLILLFQGGNGKRGNKSARQLRNGYLHQLSDSDRQEIIDKQSVFIPEMKAFLRKRIRLHP